MRLDRAGLLLTLLCVGATRVDADVLLLDIDRAGAATVDALKTAPEVRAWSEIGETLAVEAAPDFDRNRALRDRVIATLAIETLDQLVTRALVHCNGSEAGHDKHASASNVLFERGHWQLLPTRVKAAGDEQLRPGRVVAYQQTNRIAKDLTHDPAIDAIVAAIDISQWRSKVNALATNHRQTAAGFGAAATQVESAFTALGLEVSRQAFTPPTNVAVDGRSFNVLGLQRGLGQGTLIVGAHLDSRNRTWDESLPSPGAEDNASGCAGVMETARVLHAREFAADILYICYGLEERGLFGGKAHAASLTPSDILGVINMDMIAFDGDGLLDLSLQATAPGFGLQQRLADNATRYADLFIEVAQQTCCSDHQPYLDRGIPAVLLIENDYGSYPQYHTVDDTADRISDAMAHETLKVAISTAAEIARLQSGSERYNGYWYNPDQSGHGFHVEVQDSGLIFLTWYTFGANGERLWIIATGTLDGNHARIPAHEAVGGAFPPAFNETQVDVVPWGEFELQFSDCSHLTIEWRPLPSTGLPAGSMQAIRSSEPRGGGCS